MAASAPQKRNACYDIVRIIAFFFVVSVHFLKYSGFYDEPISSGISWVLILVRGIFMCSVPLFIMLTGCLMNRKAISKSYYLSVGKHVFVYCIASLLCFLYAYSQEPYPAGIGKLLINAVSGTLSFSWAKYAWYIEMYLGLFLMIPFLNLIYGNLSSKKEKQLLLLTCFLLFSAPALLNTHRLFPLSWWKNPVSMQSYHQLIPAWWTDMYPIGYYFLGCYLAEYKPKGKPAVLALAFCAVSIVFSLYTYWRNVGAPFLWGVWSEYSSPFVVLLSALFMLFWMNLDLSRIPEKMKAFLAGVSNCCLGAYLVSWIFDMQVYPDFLSKLPPEQKLKYYFMYVPLIFCCSIVLSYFINKFYAVCAFLCRFAKRKLKNPGFLEK